MTSSSTTNLVTYKYTTGNNIFVDKCNYKINPSNLYLTT